MTKWDEISGSVDYKNLSTTDKSALRTEYFKRVIVPELETSDIESGYAEFMRRTEPSFTDKALDYVPEFMGGNKATGAEQEVATPPVTATKQENDWYAQAKRENPNAGDAEIAARMTEMANGATGYQAPVDSYQSRLTDEVGLVRGQRGASGSWGSVPPTQEGPGGTIAPTQRTAAETARDAGLGFMEGSAQTGKMLGDIYGIITGDMNNWVSSNADAAAKYWRAKQSKTQRDIDSAAQKQIAADEARGGFWAGLWSGAKHAVDDPLMTVSRQLSNLAIGGAGSVVTKGLAKKFIGQATERTLIEIGTAGGIATGAAMQGADIGSDAYEEVAKTLIKKGVPAEVAHTKALALGRTAAVKAAVVSIASNKLVPFGDTLERVFAGGLRSGGLKGAAIGAMKAISGESIQEGIEEGAGKLFQNEAVGTVDPTVALMREVGGATGQGMATGALMGGAPGAIAGFVGGQDAQSPTTDTSQKPDEAITPRGYMTRDQIDAAANAELDRINLKAKGTPDQTIKGPDGKPVVVQGEPAQLLSDEDRSIRDFIIANQGNHEKLAGAFGYGVARDTPVPAPTGPLTSALAAAPVVSTPDAQQRQFGLMSQGQSGFNQQSELADLIAQESADLDHRRQAILGQQEAQRGLTLESELETTDARVEGARQAESRRGRLKLLDEVYANQNERTPAITFLARLEAEYPNNPDPTPEEKAFIAQRESAYQAFKKGLPVNYGQPPVTPNEGGDFGIKELGEKMVEPARNRILVAQKLLATGNRLTKDGIRNKDGRIIFKFKPGEIEQITEPITEKAPNGPSDIAAAPNYPDANVEDGDQVQGADIPGSGIAIPDAMPGLPGGGSSGASVPVGDVATPVQPSGGAESGEALATEIGQPAINAKAKLDALKAKQQSRLKPIDDARVPGMANDLREMAKLTGWAQEGGRMIRGSEDPSHPDYNKISRTTWIPRPDSQWYAGMANKLSGQDAIDAVDDAIAGRPMKVKAQRFVSELMDIIAEERKQAAETKSARLHFEREQLANEASALGIDATGQSAEQIKAAIDAIYAQYDQLEREALQEEVDLADAIKEEVDDIPFGESPDRKPADLDTIFGANWNEESQGEAQGPDSQETAPTGIAPAVPEARPGRTKQSEGADAAATPARGTTTKPERDGVAKDKATPVFSLVGQTTEEVKAQEQDRLEQIKLEEAETKKRDEDARKLAIENERKGRVGIASDEYTLDATEGNAAAQKKADKARADDQFAGQGNIFAQPAPAKPNAQPVDITVNDIPPMILQQIMVKMPGHQQGEVSASEALETNRKAIEQMRNFMNCIKAN